MRVKLSLLVSCRCGEVKAYQLSDIINIQVNEKEEDLISRKSIPHFNPFDSAIPSSHPYLDIIQPIAKGHRAFLQIHNGEYKRSCLRLISTHPADVHKRSNDP